MWSRTEFMYKCIKQDDSKNLFLFLIKQDQQTDMPKNIETYIKERHMALMDVVPIKQDLLKSIKDPDSVSFGWWSINEYKQLAFPFIPFVTGCTQYQNHIYLFDVLQNHQNCDLKQPYKITYPSILNLDQTSDTCNVFLHCKSNLTNRDIK